MIGEFVVKVGSRKAFDILRRTPEQSVVADEQSTTVADIVIDVEPIENYGVLSSPQIIALIGTLDIEDVKAVQLFEQRNRGRRTILAATQAVLDR